MTFKHKLSVRLAMLKDKRLLVALIGLLACEKPVRLTGPAPLVTRIVITPPQIALRTNQTSAFTAVGLTAVGDTGNIPVTWQATGGSIVDTTSNGDRHIATYQPSTQPGTYMVVATTPAGGMADTSTVTIVPTPVAAVVVTPTVATLLLGATLQLAAAPQDSSGAPLSGRVVTWASSAPAVAAVSASGLVTAVATGSATVTATSEGKTGSAAITVTTVPVATVTVSPASANLVLGATQQLSAVTLDSAGGTLTGRVVAWSSNNTTVATVSTGGLVTGRAAGSATVTAASEGKTGSATIAVINVPVATVTVNPASATILVGATQLLAAVTKDSAGGTLTGRVVTWASSNTSVASVNGSGLVSGQSAGSATITATSEGKSGTALMTVQAPLPGTHTGYYVTPGGSASGNGSAGQPWDLATALGSSVVQPGDTVWLRAGTYTGSFTSRLSGSVAAPVVVRQYPGERATIKGPITLNGSDVWLWGFEITQNASGGYGIFDNAPRSKMINLVVHDAQYSGIGFWKEAPNSEVYGSILYNNGTRNNQDHGIYVQNTTGIKLLRDNIVFNNWGFGLHGYAGPGETGYLTGIIYQGNTLFNASLIGGALCWDMLMGGSVATGPNSTADTNFVYRPDGQLGVRLDAGSGGLRYTFNNIVGATATVASSWAQSSNTGLGNAVYVRPNLYELGRANVTIYNATLASSVAVDLSGVLSVGQAFTIVNAQDFYGTPVVSGTYAGGTVNIPMAGVTPPTPVGRGHAGPATGPRFQVFVVRLQGA